MFARFRDENALMDSGFVMPAASRLSGVQTGSAFAEPDKDAIRTLVLNNGRKLAWSEFGHKHGYPCLYMHRQGGCRLEALLLHEAAKSAGFRLIAVDRPGLGGSDFFSFEDPDTLASDYIELIDQLELPHVAVFSWGGGSRFALAMAARFPSRVSFVNLVSPRERSCTLTKNPLFATPFKIALRLLFSVRTLRASKDDARYLQRLREQMCHTDRKEIDDPQVGSLLARIARESTSQGAAGLAQDIWFGMTAVAIDETGVCGTALPMPVHIWNGSADAVSRPQVSYQSNGVVKAREAGAGVFRHWVRRQGHLFFRQAAGDIFRVARRATGASLVAADPLHR